MTPTPNTHPAMLHVYGDAVVTPAGEIITLPPTMERATILRETYEAFPEAGIVHHYEVASYWDDAR